MTIIQTPEFKDSPISGVWIDAYLGMFFYFLLY